MCADKRSGQSYVCFCMRPGARTPEEVETLLEEAFVVRDRDALAQQFEDGAVLVAGGGLQEARGGSQIARFATAMWERDRTYLADPRPVLQSRDTALVVAERAINVLRRGSDAHGATRSRSWTPTTRPRRRSDDAAETGPGGLLEGDATFEVGNTPRSSSTRAITSTATRRPAPLHGRGGRLPAAVHPHPRRIRGPG